MYCPVMSRPGKCAVVRTSRNVTKITNNKKVKLLIVLRRQVQVRVKLLGSKAFRGKVDSLKFLTMIEV